jgi:hypothetical protein
MMNKSLKITLMLLISIILMTSTSIAVTDTEIQEDDAGNAIDDISGEFFFNYNYNKEIVDIQPYEGSITPSHPMYGLKIVFRNMDETFTNDVTERFGKQISSARQFIAETITELNEGDEENAAIALGYYRNKIEDIDHTLAGSNLNSLDLTYANEMTQKNCEAIEENLATKNFANIRTRNGLENVLNQSLQLRNRFNLTIQQRINNSVQSGNLTDSNGQMGSGQAGSGQTGSGQTGSGQTGSGQTGSGQTGGR